MPKAKRRSSFAGMGCALQGLGLVSLAAAVFTSFTIVGGIFFGVLGLWLLVYGSSKTTWYECSDCGTVLSRKRLKKCPGCREELG